MLRSILLCVGLLSVVLLSVVLLRVILLRVILQSVSQLIFILQNVILLSHSAIGFAECHYLGLSAKLLNDIMLCVIQLM
jgi:hypothetical protein